MPGAPVFLSHPSSLEHDTGGASRAARRGSWRSSASSTLAAGSGGSVRSRRKSGSRRCGRSIRPSTSRPIEAFAAAGGGHFDARHARRAPARTRRRCTPPAARSRSSTCCSTATCAVRVQRPPAARSSRAPAPGDGLLPVQQRRGRRSSCARAPRALERVMVLDWDVHHGNGTNDIFYAEPRGPVRLDPPIAAVPGHGDGVRGRRGRRPRVHRQPAGAARVRATASSSRWSPRWRCRCSSATRRSWC